MSAEFNRRILLAAASAQKLLMTCGTGKTTTPGLTSGHAYALLEYHSPTDMVEIWNPHGNNFTSKGPPGPVNGYATKSGRFIIPVTELRGNSTACTSRVRGWRRSRCSSDDGNLSNCKTSDPGLRRGGLHGRLQ
jgi:hypothetical protein